LTAKPITCVQTKETPTGKLIQVDPA
jgi:hypothetical protein